MSEKQKCIKKFVQENRAVDEVSFHKTQSKTVQCFSNQSTGNTDQSSGGLKYAKLCVFYISVEIYMMNVQCKSVCDLGRLYIV